jgi:predicted metal-binding membrane protein
MSMMWMPMPGQTWPGVAASFLGMWVSMTVAMMLPSLTPTLWRYREAVARSGETHPSLMTGVVGAGYFFVWVVFGMITFALGTAMVATAMHLPAVGQAVPITVGVIVLIAGGLQFTAWKAHHLACSREIAGRGRSPTVNPITAWRRGVHLGLHCGQCCGSLMVVSLAVAGMDLRVMAVMGAAIAAERLAPAGERVARAIGVVVVASGLFLIARAAIALLAT